MMERKKYKVLTTEHQGIGIHFSPGNTLPIHLESTNLKGKGDKKKKKKIITTAEYSEAKRIKTKIEVNITVGV